RGGDVRLAAEDPHGGRLRHPGDAGGGAQLVEVGRVDGSHDGGQEAGDRLGVLQLDALALDAGRDGLLRAGDLLDGSAVVGRERAARARRDGAGGPGGGELLLADDVGGRGGVELDDDADGVARRAVRGGERGPGGQDEGGRGEGARGEQTPAAAGSLRVHEGCLAAARASRQWSGWPDAANGR